MLPRRQPRRIQRVRRLSRQGTTKCLATSQHRRALRPEADRLTKLLEVLRLHLLPFEELGEAISLGTERAAVLTGGKAFGGALARQARFALYTSRLPTWQHRLRVGASWFFGGTTPRPLLPLGFER